MSAAAFACLVAALFAAVALLAAAAAWSIFRRYDRAMLGSLATERRAVEIERLRVLELEQMLDKVRARSHSVTLTTPADLRMRAHAHQQPPEEQLPDPEPSPLPREIEAQLAQVDDDEARSEIRELAQYRMAQGVSPETVLSEIFS